MTNRAQRSQHNRTILMRSISAVMALAASAVLIGGDAEYRKTDTSTNEPKVAAISKPEISKSSPEQYIMSIAESMPSYQRAKSAGIIEGIMYEPSEKEVLERVNRSLMQSKSGPEPEEILTNVLEMYRNSRNSQVSGATVIPVSWIKDLPGIKRTIVFSEKSLHSEYLSGKRELKNLIEHELQHAEDFFNGLWGVEPLAGKLSKGEWDWELWRNLLELRAQHRQMNDIFGIGESSRPLLFNREWIVIQIRRYYRLWSFCKEYQPKTEAWRKIRDSQFKVVKDIYPKREGLTIFIMRREGQKEYGIKAEFQDLSQLAGSDL